MAPSLLSFLAPALLVAELVLAAPSASTTQACKDIDAILPDRLSWPLELDYISETQEYWSTALRDLQPACVVHPEDVDEVASIVQILNKYPDVEFAAKSGGHDPNPGHGSIQDGILIALRYITGTTYDANTNLASVKPGGTWNDVIGALAPYNVTVVGGRLGIVGVGGYLLQGGISFLSSQYGLAADSVVGWEIVLPNGTIANINATTQPDLAVALRGSGSQFGIVTKFTIETHPISQVWGGLRAYTDDHRDELYAALHSFVPNNVNDQKAAVIFTDILAIDAVPLIIVYYFYDGETPPTDGPLGPFLDIDYLIDATGTKSYADLLETNGDPAAFYAARFSFREFTIPHVPDYPGIYQEIHDYWSSTIQSALALTEQCSIDFQPVPSVIGQHSEERGGNALGLSSSDPNRLFLEMECAWAFGLNDATVYGITEDVTAWLETRIPEWNAMAGLPADAYLPYFMNDAGGDQNVTSSYKAYDDLKALQREVDADGLFNANAGGFKY
ncbi:hypothetical protein E8E14_005749 [Neopestalotiopsis sp. 37M]|nr:hypothetical protein E8E14_005749 [Neopestalotiopsis sp. 37M]